MEGANAIENTREDESSTTHISVIDANGNMVSYTTTLSELFGSAMVVPGFGFLLNDSLRDFDLEGRAPNEARGGKRPKSGISPTFVFNQSGQPRLIAGAAGGNRIPAIVFSIISHVLDQNRAVDVAVGAPRIVNENRSTGIGVSNTRYEPAPFTLPLSLINELRNRMQIITRNTLFFGAAQCIGIDPDTGALSRGMDPRRGGEF
jgi:gamma-glutamyltranspeptidase/glutathione hydrolase